MFSRVEYLMNYFKLSNAILENKLNCGTNFPHSCISDITDQGGSHGSKIGVTIGSIAGVIVILAIGLILLYYKGGQKGHRPDVFVDVAGQTGRRRCNRSNATTKRTRQTGRCLPQSCLLMKEVCSEGNEGKKQVLQSQASVGGRGATTGNRGKARRGGRKIGFLLGSSRALGDATIVPPKSGHAVGVVSNNGRFRAQGSQAAELGHGSSPYMSSTQELSER